jgi:mannose-6-phosphate isomerase-like protein (cupin superfamily)/hypoxanthine phosphoribosyltransferase
VLAGASLPLLGLSKADGVDMVSSGHSARTIAGELIGLQRNGIGATVILGAGASVSSGVPSWADLAHGLCRELGLEDMEANPIEGVMSYFGSETTGHLSRYHHLEPYLSGKKPSSGYMHLAHLAREGFVRVILTTNWDSLVEEALHRVLPAERIKTYVRGEVSDEVIARVLETNTRGPTVVKLHGDLAARLFFMTPKETGEFHPNLVAALHRLMDGLVMMVGQSAQDIDLLGTLLTRRTPTNDGGTLYHVRHGPNPDIDRLIEKSAARVIEGTRQHVLGPAAEVHIGDFDHFFTQVNLAVQLRQSTGQIRQRERVQTAILDKEKRGLGYINYTTITSLVAAFINQVKNYNPNLIFFINDPSAPGGPEIKRRMVASLEGREVGEILIQGEGSSRVYNRLVRSDTPSGATVNPKRVLIIDSITFSGNTLKLARDKVREWYPNSQVRAGVLVISQQLTDLEESETPEHERILYEAVTDRYEIFFPWGVTQTTSRFKRHFVGVSQEGDRTVAIDKRPWGAVEILANEEHASVRLLTIEAHNKLSFQRHLCRDELFVALDDNIGLDICAADLPRDVDQYDPRIASLVLEKGDYILIPRGVWHRTKASMDRVRLLEVAFGIYDQVYDIERRWDDFRRESMDGAR